MSCLACYAETSNGLALCERCRATASVDLTYLPVYFRNLARWRPGRAGGSRQVPGSRVLYDGTVRGSGTGDKISDALDATHNAVVTWARGLADDRGTGPRPLTAFDAVLAEDLPEEVAERYTDHPEELVAVLCGGFERRLTSVATLEWAGEFVRELGQHEKVLRALTERSVPGWYAGACRRCKAATYVLPGLTWVTCGSCGATTYARDHLETILTEARGWVARPKAIAEAIVALVDTELSVPRLYTRIRQWAFQGDIEAVWRTSRGYVWSDEEQRLVVAEETVGHARYRMGEVLDLVFRDTRRVSTQTRVS